MAQETVTREIEAVSRPAANNVRDEVDSRYLADSDDRRTMTVRVAEDAPDDVAADIRDRVMQTWQDVTEKHGQVEIDRREKAELKDRSKFDAGDLSAWNHARACKALALDLGCPDWLDFYQPDVEVTSHRSSFRKGGDERGRDAFEKDGDDYRRMTGEAIETARKGERKQAEKYAADGDDDAARFLIESHGYTEEDISDLRGEPVDLSTTDDAETAVTAVDATDAAESGGVVAAFVDMAASLARLTTLQAKHGHIKE